MLLVMPPFVHIPGRRGQVVPDPPMGLAYLASYVRRHFPNQIEVRIIDSIASRLSEDALVRVICDHRPDVLGYTSMTATAGTIKRIASRVKQKAGGIIQVAGGPHASSVPSDLLPPLDVIVRGEGEETLLETLIAISSKGSLKGISGASYLDNGERVENHPRPFISDIDSLPFPARDLLPIRIYRHEYPILMHGRSFSTMFTMRGCPWNCTFCNKGAVWADRVRYRKVEGVFEELEHMRKTFNPSYVLFYDDTFTAKRSRTLEFCDRFAAGGFDIRWSCITRADCLDAELMDRMKKAGCDEIQIGVESGSERILQSVGKRLRMQTLHDTFKTLRYKGIRTKAFFILGHLEDDEETLRQTIETAVNLDPTWAVFSVMVPFPGTKAFTIAKERGYLRTTDWDSYRLYGKPIIQTERFSTKRLAAVRRMAYRRFYFRWRKMVRYLKDMLIARDFSVIIRNLFALLNLSGGIRGSYEHP